MANLLADKCRQPSYRYAGSPLLATSKTMTTIIIIIVAIIGITPDVTMIATGTSVRELLNERHSNFRVPQVRES